MPLSIVDTSTRHRPFPTLAYPAKVLDAVELFVGSALLPSIRAVVTRPRNKFRQPSDGALLFACRVHVRAHDGTEVRVTKGHAAGIAGGRGALTLANGRGLLCALCGEGVGGRNRRARE